MKKPTLSELIEAAEKAVKPDDWYRQSLILEKFHGMSKTTLVEYWKELFVQDIQPHLFITTLLFGF